MLTARLQHKTTPPQSLSTTTHPGKLTSNNTRSMWVLSMMPSAASPVVATCALWPAFCSACLKSERSTPLSSTIKMWAAGCDPLLDAMANVQRRLRAQ